MTCQDCSRLDIQNSSLQRQLERLRADLKEAEFEVRGLRAEVYRLREQNHSLASQITRTP